MVTSTTRIAGAGVLGNERRPDDSCAPDPAPLDEGPDPREVRHAAGSTEVRADPQRIVVLSGDQLDALCALGLQSRIVAAALPDGSTSQPSYLGTVVHDVPAAGSRTAPDLGAIRAASPDLILGSQGLTAQDYGPLSAIAPTVFTGPPGAAWQDTLRTVGDATGRADAANRLLDGFAEDAQKTGAQNDATHFQASVVRFTDKPYLEIGISDEDMEHSPDFSAADGDIVYVSFDSQAAKQRAATVFEGDAWRKLSANRDGRVFAVNDEVWQTGEGIVAARGVLADLRYLNAPIN